MAADLVEMTLWSILPPKGLTTPGKTQVFVGIDVLRAGAAKPGSITATCTPDRGYLRCVVDCGGGSFALQAGLGGALGLYNSLDGMRLQACALTADASQSEMLPPLREAPPYVLYRLTDADCAAFAAKRTPKPD